MSDEGQGQTSRDRVLKRDGGCARWRMLTLCALFFLPVSSAFSIQSPVPGFSKAFSPSTIGSGSVSTLTFTITELVGTPVTDLAFTDSLPDGMVIATPGFASTDCVEALLSAPDNGATITFSGGKLGANASCSVSVDVTVGGGGVLSNVSGDLTSSVGNSGSASADLTVDFNRPGFQKAFSPGTITEGGTSTLTFTIDNTPNEGSVSGLVFTDTLPDDMVIASPANAATDCGSPILTAIPGSNSISLQGGFVGGGSTCTLAVDVTAPSAGSKHNSSGELTSGSVSSGKANATLEVTRKFLNKVFTNDPVAPNGTVRLRFSMTNFDRSDSATAISFTDDLDATLSGLVATGLPMNDVCGAGSSISGTDLLTFTGGNLAPEASCTFDVDLTVPSGAAPGSYTNTTSTVSLDIGGAGTTKDPASDTLVVSAIPLFTKEFIDDPVVAGSDVTLRFSITNTDASASATSIVFTDELTTFLPFPVTVSLPMIDVCGAGSTLTLVSLGTDRQGLSLAGGNLAAAASCSFDVVITVPLAQPSGSYLSTTNNITATVGGAPLEGGSAADTLVVAGGPTLSKSFVDAPILPGDTMTLEFTLNYSLNAAADATAISFTDDLDAALSGLVATGLPLDDVCGAGSQLNGTSTLSFTGGSMAPGDSCTFSVSLQSPGGAAVGVYTNTTSAVSAMSLGLALTSVPASADFRVSGLTFSKRFTDDPVGPGDNVTLEYTLSNANSVDTVTSIAFTDDMDEVVAGLAATGLPMSDVCGAGSSISGTDILTFANGTLDPGASCTFSVTLAVPGGAIPGEYSSISSGLSALEGAAAISGLSATDLLNIEVDLPPSVQLSTTTSNPTNANPIPLNILFSEAVTGLELTDFVVVNGAAGNLAGSGASYTVEITPTADGTVTVDLPAMSVIDGGGNDNTAATQFSVLYDSTGPALTIGAPSVSLTRVGPVSYIITYTNAETVDLTPTDVTLNATGTAAGTATVSNGSSATPTVTVAGISGDGSLGISIAANTARSGTLSTSPAGPSATFSVDNTAPGVVITTTAGNPSNDATIPLTISFSETVSGFAADDLVVTNATAGAISDLGGGVYSVTLTATAEGSVTLDIAAGAAQDTAGNTSTGATQFSIVIDLALPQPVVTTSSPLVTNSTSIPVEIDFGESMIGFDVSDLVLGNASASAFTDLGGGRYSLNLIPAADGTVTVNIAAAVAQDVSGNNNIAAQELSIQVDTTPPVPGALTTAAGTAFTIPVSWTNAADAAVAETELSYTLYYTTASYSLGSTTAPADIMQVESQTGMSLDGNANAVLVTDLAATTTYYFNIVVQDPLGQKSLYVTSPVSGATREFRRDDTDGDGLPDDVEINAGLDETDPNNVPAGSSDADGDGLSNAVEDFLENLTSSSGISTLTDSDGDGVPDYLEILTGSDPLDANSPVANGGADSDGDGVSDALESVLGTDANGGADPDSNANGVADAIDSFLLDFYGISNIRKTTDTDGDGVPDLLEALYGLIPNNAGSPAPNGRNDDDRDEVSNGIEAFMVNFIGAVNPYGATDTDADTLPDALEVRLAEKADDASVPYAGGAGDGDADGVSDGIEAYLQSLGVNAPDAKTDSDADLIPDAREVRLGTRPLSAVAFDDDSDGLSNAYELYLAGNGGSADSGFSTDTDGDGLPDYLEALADFNDPDRPVTGAGGVTPLDTDADTVPDTVESWILDRKPGLSDVNAGTDSDGDGVTDYQEMLTGSNPFTTDRPYATLRMQQAIGNPVAFLNSAGPNAFVVASIAGAQRPPVSYSWDVAGLAGSGISVVGGTDTATLELDMSSSIDGFYSVGLTVERTLGSVLYRLDYDLLVPVAAGDGTDADNDLIPDAIENQVGGFQTQNSAGGFAVITNPPGVGIVAGDLVIANGLDSADVSSLLGAALTADWLGEFNIGVFDFDIVDLPPGTTTVTVILPMTDAIPVRAVYRKHDISDIWRIFDGVESAPGSLGDCSGMLTWTPDLTAGHFCVRLTLVDGDPVFDRDGALDGRISDPGGVVQKRESGGGSDVWLWMIALIALLAGLRGLSPVRVKKTR